MKALSGLTLLTTAFLASADEPSTTTEEKTDPKVEAVAEAVERFTDQPETQAGSVGFSVRFLDVPTEGQPGTIAKPAYEALGNKSLLPASTLKLVTTGCALEILGKDYQFSTVLKHDGSLDAETGLLAGNVHIVGNGDPTLAEDGWSILFGKWLEALQEAGIKNVNGHVVGDGTAFHTQAVSGAWTWDDIGNYYAPNVTGLNFYRNTFRISFQPGSVGSIAMFIGTNPKVPELKFVNEMYTGSASSGDQGYVYGAPYATTYYLRGSIPRQEEAFSIKGALPDPAYFCAHQFDAYLKTKGIPVEGAATTVRRGDFKKSGTPIELSTHLSRPLNELIRPVNHKSLNLDAEALLKAIGNKRSNKGTTADGAKAVLSYLVEQGLATTGFDMIDGCGLARGNGISPNQLTAILALFANRNNGLRESLPIAGRSGTLKSIGGGTSAEGRIRGKSGTVHRTKCYAGYVDCQSGRTAAFAIMVNQYTGSYAPVKSGITSVMARLAEM